MPRVVGGQHKVHADLLELYVRSRAKEGEMRREDWAELLDITMPKLEHLRPLLEIREFTRLAYVMALVGSERDAPLASRAVAAMLVNHWRDPEPCRLLQKDAIRHATVTSVELTEYSTAASIAKQLRRGVCNALEGLGVEPMGVVKRWSEACILITGGRGGIEAEVDDLALRCGEAENSAAALEVLQAYVKQRRMDTFVKDFLTWGKDQLKRLPPTMLDSLPKRKPSRARARPLTGGGSRRTEERNSRGAWALLPSRQQQQQQNNGGAITIVDDRAAVSDEELEISGGSRSGRGTSVTARANKRTPSPSLVRVASAVVAPPSVSANDGGASAAFSVTRGVDNPPPPVQSLNARGAPAADTGASFGAPSGLGSAGERGAGDEGGRSCSPKGRRSFDETGAKRGRKGAVRSVDDLDLDRSVVCSLEPEGDSDVGKETISCSMSPRKKDPASTGKKRDVAAALQDVQCRRSPRKTTGRQGELLKNDQVLFSKVVGKSTSWTPGVLVASHRDGKYDLLASGERARFVGRADLHPRKRASAAPAGCSAEIFRRPLVVNSDPQSGSGGISRPGEDTPARTLHPIRRAGIRKPADVECGKATQHVYERKKQEQADLPGEKMETEDTGGREGGGGGGGVGGIRGSDRKPPEAGDTPRRPRGRPGKRPREQSNPARVANIDNGYAGAGGPSIASSSITGEDNWEAASLAKSDVSGLSPGSPEARRGRDTVVDRGCGRAAGNSPLLVRASPSKRRRSERAQWDFMEYGGGVDGGQERDGEHGSAGSVVPTHEEIAAHLESSGGREIEKDDPDSTSSEEDARSPRKRRLRQRNG